MVSGDIFLSYTSFLIGFRVRREIGCILSTIRFTAGENGSEIISFHDFYSKFFYQMMHLMMIYHLQKICSKISSITHRYPNSSQIKIRKKQTNDTRKPITFSCCEETPDTRRMRIRDTWGYKGTDSRRDRSSLSRPARKTNPRRPVVLSSPQPSKSSMCRRRGTTSGLCTKSETSTTSDCESDCWWPVSEDYGTAWR